MEVTETAVILTIYIVSVSITITTITIKHEYESGNHRLPVCIVVGIV